MERRLHLPCKNSKQKCSTRLKVVRVICTDPDATDSSSDKDDDFGLVDDEEEIDELYKSTRSSSFRHRLLASKRFVHEVPLAASSSASRLQQQLQHRKPGLAIVSRSSSRRSIISSCKRKVRKKVISLKELGSQTAMTREDREGIIINRQKVPSLARQVEDERGDFLHLECQPSLHFSETSTVPGECAQEVFEGFSTYDSEIMKSQIFSEIKDLELDSEAMTWINSFAG